MVVQKISFTLGLMVIIKALLWLWMLNWYIAHNVPTYATLYTNSYKHGDHANLWAHICQI